MNLTWRQVILRLAILYFEFYTGIFSISCNRRCGPLKRPGYLDVFKRLQANFFAEGRLSFSARNGSFLYEGTLFAGWGFAGSFVGIFASQGCATLQRKFLKSNDVTLTKQAPNKRANSVAWAGLMFVSRNRRYETVAGIERVFLEIYTASCSENWPWRSKSYEKCARWGKLGRLGSRYLIASASAGCRDTAVGSWDWYIKSEYCIEKADAERSLRNRYLHSEHILSLSPMKLAVCLIMPIMGSLFYCSCPTSICKGSFALQKIPFTIRKDYCSTQSSHHSSVVRCRFDERVITVSKMEWGCCNHRRARVERPRDLEIGSSMILSCALESTLTICTSQM